MWSQVDVKGFNSFWALSVLWGRAAAVTALCTAPHTALLKPGAPVGVLWWGAHEAVVLGTLVCCRPWCYITWVWSSLWLVPVAGWRWFPSLAPTVFATGTVESVQQIHSQQNPKQIALHQGWTWPFILNSSKGKRSEKNMSIFLTVLMFGCANKCLSSNRRGLSSSPWSFLSWGIQTCNILIHWGNKFGFLEGKNGKQ